MNLAPGGLPIALVSGIDIHGSTLYGINRTDGEVFRIDLTNPSAPGAPQLVADIDSAGKGSVDTRDLEVNPADGLIYIAGYSWTRPIVGGAYMGASMVKVSPAGAPNGTVSIYEVPIPTPPGPNNENRAGARDITFGSFTLPAARTASIGSLVWSDMDADGVADAGEPGIPGVRVELWKDTDGNTANGAEQLVGWTFTDATVTSTSRVS